jgi:catechol-2,3-dioxygenase
MTQTVPAQEIVDENGVRIIAPTLHHTGHQTARKAEMLRWYREVLGQQHTVTADYPWEITWTTNDWAHHRMSFGAMPGVDKEITATSPGVAHIAWEFESLDDLLTSWQRIKNLGIEPQFCVCHYITYAFYYRDPDGNLVELFADAFDDHDRSYAAWTTEARVAAYPAGAAVDPAKLIKELANGTSRDELRERGYAGELAPDAAEQVRNHDMQDYLDEQAE